MKQSLRRQDIAMKKRPKCRRKHRRRGGKEMWQRAHFRARRSHDDAIANAP